MNFTTVKGQPIRIMWSQRDPSVRRSGLGNVFIKNLEKSIDNKALNDTFGIFGKILSCKVATRPVEKIIDGKKEIVDESLGYGFVHFETSKSAEMAIQKVNGMMINNKKVFVGLHLKKQERDKDGSEKQVLFTNVYVNNLPKSFENKDLYQLFEKYGEIISAVVEKVEKIEISENEEKKVFKAFGFVCFKNPEDAMKASEEMNNYEIDGKKIYCGRAEKKSERIQKLREEFKKKMDEFQKFQGLNLYFKNIDDNAYTEETLRKAFEEFGEVSSFTVMKNDDEKKTSKGFGFVSYKNAEDAQNAITKLHNKSLTEKSKPLYVCVAQRKDLRRQQLEVQHSQRQNFNQLSSYSNILNQGTPNQFYNNIMRPRWTNQNQNNNSNNMNQNRKKNTNQNNNNMNQKNQNQKNQNQTKGFKFNQNVKNKENQNNLNNSNQNTSNQTQTEEVNNNSNELSPSVLANLEPNEVRQILGEKLYPLVLDVEGVNESYAGKITGMLLDLESSEILILLESPESLTLKVKKAVEMLENYQNQKKE
jgi:polyadenylate-binding protein